MSRLICSRMTRAFGAVAAVLLVAAPSLAAQTGSITGRVTDATSGQPVTSAQVFITDLDLGVLTQQNGSFNLQNVPAGSQTVTVQRLGFREESQTVTVNAGGATVVDFAIEQAALQLDEVIVTGTPGGTQRRAIGNSVERLDAAAVTERAAITDMQDLLAARTPGLRFGGLDGQVGGGRGITIRGVSSVSLGSQPLIYVDGIRVNNDATLGPDTGSSSNATALNDLNPDEIESIEVIKGPAAATLYGTEASAGVIQIITKRGEVGAPEFTFETSQGSNFMIDPAGVLGDQYACSTSASLCPEDQVFQYNMYNEASDYLRSAGRYEGVGLGRDSDLFGYGYSQRYNMSVRGGTDQVRYYLSGAFSDETGVLDYNTNGSTNLRANVTVLLSENLNLDVSTGFTQGQTRFATIDGEGGIWHQLVWSRGYNIPGVRSESGSGFLGFQERFPENYERTDVTREFNRFTGSMTATHSYSDWLTSRLTFGIDKGWDINTEYLPGNNNFPNAPAGALEYDRPINQNITFDFGSSARYQVTDAISTTTSAGARYYARKTDNLSNEGLGFATEVQTTINQADAVGAGYSSIENKTLGFYVQEEIGYMDRLFVTAAASTDKNSAFGDDFGYQVYPKFSASWVVSEEGFWNVDFVNSLRLRGAWGQSGRQPSTFASQNLFGTFEGPDGKGLIPTSAGNPDVGPEVSTELELGFEVAMLDDRLSADFSWYKTVTEDLLVNQSLAPSTGLPGSRDSNLGEMETWGWELAIDARLLETDNISLDLNLAGDYTTNEITGLGQDILPSGNFQLGWPFPNVASSYILREVEFREGTTQVNSDTAVCDGGLPASPGGPPLLRGGPDVLCQDFNGDLLMGPTYPNYTVRVGPTLTIGTDLQLFALAEGQYGRWNASTDANYACRFYRNCLAQVLGTDPVFRAGISNFLDDRYNGRYLADFWKLRELGMRYTLPQSLVNRIGADRASVSVSGRNLFTFWQANETDLTGNPIYDPEYAINGSTPSATALWEMPGIANFNATLRVTF